jgi:hypothetical protein
MAVKEDLADLDNQAEKGAQEVIIAGEVMTRAMATLEIQEQRDNRVSPVRKENRSRSKISRLTREQYCSAKCF